MRYACLNQLAPPTRVRVYRNLHKNCFSVVSMKTGRVIQHTNKLTLHDVEFRVRESGRQRVLRERRKNVHAFVVGSILQTDIGLPACNPERAWYDPYQVKTFVNRRTLEPVLRARVAHLEHGILYWS